MTVSPFSSLRRSFTVIGLLPALLLSYPAESLLAVSIPDAGSILRDQQQALPAPKTLVTPEEKKSESTKAEVGIRVAVKGFSFSGHDGIATESELQAIVGSAIGQNLTFTELNALADKITAFIKKKGLSQARAYLPQQDIYLRYYPYRDYRGQQCWAHVLGDNPGQSIAGNNADGLNNRSRFWLQGMFYF